MGTISTNAQRTPFYFHTDLNQEWVNGSTPGCCVLVPLPPEAITGGCWRQRCCSHDNQFVAFPAALGHLVGDLVEHLKRNHVLLLWRQRLEDSWEETPPSERELKTRHVARV